MRNFTGHDYAIALAPAHLRLKILLHAGTSSATEPTDLQIVLGGTAALRVHSDAEGGTFSAMIERPLVRRKFSWALAFTIIGLAAIGAGIFIFDRCASLPGRAARTTVDQMERVGRDVRDAVVAIARLQPRVTINNRVYFEQSSPITELALVSQRLEVEHEFSHTWAGSTKRLKLHGTFTARAGFDLRQEFSVNVQPAETIVRLPHAQLLSVQQDAVDVLVFENGYWNPISGTDVESELATLNRIARDEARASDAAAQAEKMFQTQLSERLPGQEKVHVIFYETKPRT